jgi:hypothetical protein
MAESGERRMLFDTRGRRRHVIRVVYAVLALLMGASLFLVVGPFNLGELGGSGSSSSAGEVLEERAERIEAQLKANPRDEELLLSLSRTRIGAGNALIDTDPQTGNPVSTPESRTQFEAGVTAWRRYLEQAKEPNTAAATLVAGTYFSLAENSTTFQEIEEYIEGAAEAQALAAEARPTPGALSTLAIYEYFDGDFAAGDRASKEAQDLIRFKAEKKLVTKQLAPYRKQAKQFHEQAQKFAKTQQGQGKEAFESALGGASGGGLSGPSLGQ